LLNPSSTAGHNVGTCRPRRRRGSNWANVTEVTAMKANVVLSLAVLAALVAFPHGAFTGEEPGKPNRHVLPINSKPYGMSYGEWSAAWWQWAYSLPADGHPLFDTADCSEGQSGKVWFLGGTFTTVEEAPGVVVGEAERECTVPAGTALFFPIVNAEANTFDDPDASEEDLRGVANFLGDHIQDLSCTIDGTPVEQLHLFRAESPQFTIGPLPENNILGIEAGSTAKSVGDGVFLMLAPLPKGTHVIEFSGAAVFTAEDDGFDFVFMLNIRYCITVE
jgi:hypothetical protein